MNTLLAEERYTGGDEQAAARIAMTALISLRPYRQSVWLHNLLLGRAVAAEGEGYLAAASVIREEDAEVAIATGAPLYALEARLERARSRAKSGDRDAAAQDIAASRRLIKSLGSGLAQQWFHSVAEIVATTAHLGSRVVGIDSAIQFFALWSGTQHVSALLARAELLSSHDIHGAERDLDSALAVLSRPVGDLNASQRAALLASARSIFARAALVHLAAGDSAEALRVLERGRADSVFSNRPSSPKGTVVVDFLIVGDTLVTWVVNGASIRVARATISTAVLERTIAQAHTTLELGADAQVSLGALYDRLIRPVEPLLPSGRTIVIVADDILGGIPFSALFDSERSRYLIEDHPLRVMSSLAEAVRPPVTPARGPALFIADPAFDRARFPGLGRLEGASSEARSSAALYPHAIVLEGKEASPTRTIALMRSAPLIHLAGHAVYDAVYPERSRFALASDESGAGELMVGQLADLELRGAKLVVLSACETSRTSWMRSAAVTGFAQALTRAGVGGVVGTLWRVNDAATSAAMQAFHASYSITLDATAALRDAQVAMIKSEKAGERNPAEWGSFRYSGR